MAARSHLALGCTLDKPAPFAARLRAALDAKGWTVYRLSAESGVRQTAIHKLLSGERADPHWSTVQKLAYALSVTPNDFR